MPTWTLRYGSADQSIGPGRGLDIGKLRFRSQAADQFVITEPGRNFDEPAKFEEGQEIIILRDSVQWFVGRVRHIPREGRTRAENMSWLIEGPWSYFDDLTFQYTWTVKNTVTGGTSQVYKPNVFLGFSPTLGLINVGQQIRDAVQFCINEMAAQGLGVKMQIGYITPGIYFRPMPANSVKIAEVIRRVLKWSPNTVAYFDHSTSPPTFNVRTRQEIKASQKSPGQQWGGVSFNVNQGDPNEAIEIEARYDRRVPSVAVYYEQSVQFDGATYIVPSIDVAPPGATGRELRALPFSIDLRGASGNTLSGSLATEAIDANNANAATKQAWWKRRVPRLAGNADYSVTIDSIGVAARIGSDGAASAGYPRMLLPDGGNIAPWMNFHAQREKVSARIAYRVFHQNPVGKVQAGYIQKCDEVIEVEINATDATTGDFKTVSISDPGEAVPIGVAAYMYAQLADLQHDGDFSLVEPEVTGAAGLGNVINLTNAKEASWATMNSMIVEAEQDIRTGQTKLTFGHAEYLGPDDLVELVRFIRSLAPLPRLASVNDGLDTDELALGKQTPIINSHDAANIYKRLLVGNNTTAIVLDSDTKQIRMEDGTAALMDLKLADLNRLVAEVVAAAPAGFLDLKARRVKICVTIGGQAKQRTLIGLLSHYFQDVDDPA